MNANVVFHVVTAIYGALSAIAALASFGTDGQNRIIAVLFLVAGLMLIGLAFVPAGTARFAVLLAGLVILHGAALWQGIDQGDTHLSHHLIRLAVSAVLVLAYLRWVADSSARVHPA